jgi:hypothetical protein
LEAKRQSYSTNASDTSTQRIHLHNAQLLNFQVFNLVSGNGFAPTLEATQVAENRQDVVAFDVARFMDQVLFNTSPGVVGPVAFTQDTFPFRICSQTEKLLIS